MGALRRIMNSFTGGGRRGHTTTRRPAAGAGAGGSHNKDAQIGRAVRTAVSKLTGKR